LVGSGTAWLLTVERASGWRKHGLAVLSILLLASGIGGRDTWINRSAEWAAHDYAVALAKVDFPPGSQMIALDGEVTALKYMQQAAGLCQNATAVVADDPALRRTLIEQLLAQSEPVFLTRELEGIAERYSFTGDGPLVRVWPRGLAQSGEPAIPLDLSFAEDTLRLEGYDLVRLDQAGGPAVQLALYWRPTVQLTQTLKVSLRLLQPDGTPITWVDSAQAGQSVRADYFPLRLVAPTTTWLPGERLRDVYLLDVPSQQVGQPVQLQLVAYDAENVREVGNWQVSFTL